MSIRFVPPSDNATCGTLARDDLPGQRSPQPIQPHPATLGANHCTSRSPPDARMPPSEDRGHPVDHLNNVT